MVIVSLPVLPSQLVLPADFPCSGVRIAKAAGKELPMQTSRSVTLRLTRAIGAVEPGLKFLTCRHQTSGPSSILDHLSQDQSSTRVRGGAPRTLSLQETLASPTAPKYD